LSEQSSESDEDVSPKKKKCMSIGNNKDLTLEIPEIPKFPLLNSNPS